MSKYGKRQLSSCAGEVIFISSTTKVQEATRPIGVLPIKNNNSTKKLRTLTTQRQVIYST